MTSAILHRLRNSDGSCGQNSARVQCTVELHFSPPSDGKAQPPTLRRSGFSALRTIQSVHAPLFSSAVQQEVGQHHKTQHDPIDAKGFEIVLLHKFHKEADGRQRHEKGHHRAGDQHQPFR